MLRRFHVDEIDDDQPANVAESDLPRNFFSSLEIRLEGRFGNILPFGGLARVDIDGNQCFGVIDDDGTTRLEANLATEG